MTTLTPRQRCTVCGGILVPPPLVVGGTAPDGADYACWKCGRPYAWVGNPPTLTLLVADSNHRAVINEPAAAPAEVGRTLFRSLESNFEVMFHSTPQVQEGGTSPTRATRIFTEATASTLCQVRVAVAPPRFGSDVEILHRTLNALAMTMIQPTLTRVRNQEHRGLPALRFSFTSAARHGEGLLVLNGATLFTVVAIDHSVVGRERHRFIESFNVLTHAS
jgi:hypothetical protein